MELKYRLFSAGLPKSDLVKVNDGLYKNGKVTIRVTVNEPSGEAIAAFGSMYSKLITDLIYKKE